MCSLGMLHATSLFVRWFRTWNQRKSTQSDVVFAVTYKEGCHFSLAESGLKGCPIVGKG